jgi:hypothetical protein
MQMAHGVVNKDIQSINVKKWLTAWSAKIFLRSTKEGRNEKCPLLRKSDEVGSNFNPTHRKNCINDQRQSMRNLGVKLNLLVRKLLEGTC